LNQGISNQRLHSLLTRQWMKSLCTIRI